MKNIFLLLVAVVLLLIIKEAQPKEQLHILDIDKQDILTFDGKLFLPRTLPRETQAVNTKRFHINLAGKNYHYVLEYGRFTLEPIYQSEEVPVSIGDKIKVSGKTKLFFAREIL